MALTASEHWKHRESHTDGQGHTTTTVVTSRADVIHEPVQLRGDVHLGPGETLETEFELPVPPDGPASLQADDAGLDWTVEAKLDVPGGLDSRIEREVVVAQPRRCSGLERSPSASSPSTSRPTFTTTSRRQRSS